MKKLGPICLAIVFAFAVALVADSTRIACAAPGDIQTYAGGVGAGAATSLGLYASGVAAQNDYAYVPDSNWAVIRRVDLTTGQSVVIAGIGTPGYSGDGGPASAAAISTAGVAVDGAGNLFLAETSGRVRRLDATTGIITTIAGTGTMGFSGDGGPATAAQIGLIITVGVDAAGNVFIPDFNNHRIRRVDVVTGTITTIAGTGSPGSSGDGGPATAAQLGSPIGVAVASNGDLVVTSGSIVRRIDTSSGIITTVAGTGTSGFSGDGGPATAAALSGPYGVAFNASDDLFIAEVANDRIRRVDAGTGTITTVAGNGTAGFSGDGGSATAATLRDPWAVAVDGAGNVLIADTENRRIRRIVGGTIDTIAGNGSDGVSGDGGPASTAQIWVPIAVAIDSVGNLALSDLARIRLVAAGTRIITTIAGTGIAGNSGDGGLAIAAQLGNEAHGLAYDADDNLLIADTFNHRVRRVDAVTGLITTVAGTGGGGFSGDGGPATAAQLANPNGVTVDAAGNLFITDASNHRVRRVDALSGTITTVAGTGMDGFGGDGGLATAAAMSLPRGVAVDVSGNFFIAAGGRVRRVSATTGIITTIAGGGVAADGEGVPATSVGLNPRQITMDATGNIFVAEQAYDRIRRIDAALGTIQTVAGNGTEGFSGDGGPATAASLWEPFAVAIDAARNLYIGDGMNHRIRRVTGPAIACGDGDVQPGIEECDDGDTVPGDGCDADCKIEPATVSESVTGGGTVTLDTGNEGATPARPVQAEVTTPSGGTVSLTRDGAGGSDVGYRTVGGSIVITAPVESVETPLEFVFRLDASLLPSGQDETTVQITRNTMPVEACEGAPQAIPDPCVSSRVRLAPDAGQLQGDVVLTVLSSAASAWAFAADVCGTVPAGGCLPPAVAGKAQVQIKEGADPAKDGFAWKWSAGSATDKADFGDPDMTTDYALCVYDDAGGVPVRRLRVAIAPGGTCKGKPCWKESATGWQYKKGDFLPKGQLQLQLKSGLAGKAQIGLKAKGPHLGLALLPLTQDPRVRVQLNNGAGRCWEASYGTNSKNDGTQFKGKAD